MVRSLPQTDGPSFRTFPADTLPLDSEGCTLEAGSVVMRLQPAAAFELHHDGRRPMLVFAFGAAQGMAQNEDGQARAVASRAGSFALLRPGVRSNYRNSEPLEVLTIAYAPETAVGAAPLAEPEGARLDPGVRALAHEVRRVMLQEAFPDHDYIEALALAMLARAVQVADGAAPQRGQGMIAPFKLRRVVAHIDDRLAEKITVEELARVAGLSTAHFARAFRQTMGEAPHHFILSRRIARVRELLTDAALDLATVAFRAGFSSHAHMTSAFQKQMGLSPAAYRAALAAG